MGIGRNLFIVGAACVCSLAGADPGPPTKPIVDLGAGLDLTRIASSDVVLAKADTPDGPGLSMRTGHRQEWPGITLKPPQGTTWDATGYRVLTLPVTNAGSNPVQVGFRVDNPGGDGSRNCVQVVESLAPGEARTITAVLSATRWTVSGDVQIVGMRGTPGQTAIALDTITQIIVFVPRPKEDHHVIIGSIHAEEPTTARSADGFFPFIDELGQFIHADWPGKAADASDLRQRRDVERAALAADSGPAALNRYGGWADGPRLAATGFFRVEKIDDTWWFVDPEGCLFWSHGIDCVSEWSETGIAHREHYFRDLPDRDGPFGSFYGKGRWAPHGFYQGKTPFDTFSFYRANLFRKYGEGWQAAWADVSHARLRSWGLNSIGNWSSRDVYLLQRTPYVATIHVGGPTLAGSEGYWGKFHDVFAEGFRANLRRQLEAKDREAADPWCIGFFVDNELGWGDELSLALATLQSPPDQPAKSVFLADLQSKYGDIAALNAAWGTEHADWQALQEARQGPDRQRAGADLAAFYTKTAETYFRTIKEELAAAAPNHLYLGCRFAWVNDRAAQAALAFCDVVSYNRYETSVAGMRLPGGASRPIIIGEFHFGALDRGMFHTGLRAARDQQHRAELYRSYVEGALRHPLIVGTHWFQYVDQPTTGRGDGENYQIGFVDGCDTPYPEILAAARHIGETMYGRRSRTAASRP